jgi:DNA-3-methyladenine glycosylase
VSEGQAVAGRVLGREFFDRRPEEVAPGLLGKLLVCRAGEPPSGAKARVRSGASSARLKSCPDTKLGMASTSDQLSARDPLERVPRSSPDAMPALKTHRRTVVADSEADADSEAPDAGGILVGRIVEVEAYLGPHNNPPDPAAHARKGPTPRNLVLFGLAGHAYVYSIYGMYFCLNVSCEAEGQAGCVLIRALEPVSGQQTMAARRGLPAGMTRSDAFLRQLTSGPSRLCQALGIVRTGFNGLDVTCEESPLQIRDDAFRVPEALVTGRIGIKEAVDWPLRFALPGNACVSGPKSLTGRRVRIG